MKRFSVSLDDGTSSETSLRMLADARQGQEAAWQRLVDRYSRRVYRWCRCGGLQSADASNVSQEVFRAVARKLPEFQREDQVGSFRCWVRTIAKNKIRDHFRQVGRQVDAAQGGTDAHLHLQQAVDRVEPDRDTSGAPTRLRQVDPTWLTRLRGEFSERDWRFFWRLVVDGQTAVDVAAEFGVTANTVRLVKMRVLRRLREAFNVNPPDGNQV